MFGGTEIMQSDPYWQNDLLFYEYFHGDNGAGIGASHQTGWTALVANLIASEPTAESVQAAVGTRRVSTS